MAQHQSWNRWFDAGAIATAARSLVLASATLLVLVAPAQAQKKISAAEAKDHIGETATVCGTVASARYAASTKGQPTFLNLDKPHPNLRYWTDCGCNHWVQSFAVFFCIIALLMESVTDSEGWV